jgi:hypothetical protein
VVSTPHRKENDVRFLFLICVDPTITPDEGPDEIDRWVDRAGTARRDGAPLHSPRSAVTVRLRDGKLAATDGPFAPTTGEFIAGFDLIDCATREDAVAIAAAHPVARFGAIEIRELMD